MYIDIIDMVIEDLNFFRGFDHKKLDTIFKKYGLEVVDDEHIQNACILTLAGGNDLFKIVYIKPKKRWYVAR
ncbi:hypothetical protein [Thermodesulfovibrio sp. 3462-1]|uniref:Uncharacterized protein n=1 Tax=Thermodesulfovibrio obliviosus TaxID=3118332 RepID=A0AAU8H296_9BACT